MYELTTQQIDFIHDDIRSRGVEMESLQEDLLDHVCCILESELKKDDDFEAEYRKVIERFYKKELKEIEEETILLLTFKNYYAMKKTMIRTGIISVITLVSGSFFKIMYWPGASPLLLIGIILLSMIFLPLMFILKTRDNTSTRNKLVLGLGALIGSFLCWATLFSVMHWPGAGTGILWLIPIAISTFILIPVYFFTGIRDASTRLNTIVTTIILIGATGLQFTMVNLRPTKNQTQIKMYTYIQNEQLLTLLQKNSRNDKDALVAEINSTANELKKIIISSMTGQTEIPKDLSDQVILEEKSVGDGDGRGSQLLAHLNETVNKYNAIEGHKIKLSLDHLDIEKINSYSNYVLLNYLVQVQMFLATAESTQTASTFN